MPARAVLLVEEARQGRLETRSPDAVANSVAKVGTGVEISTRQGFGAPESGPLPSLATPPKGASSSSRVRAQLGPRLPRL